MCFEPRLMHITDWLPTLVSMAGGPKIEGIDGLDLLPHFNGNLTGIRSEMLYGIDPKHEDNEAAYRQHEMKILIEPSAINSK